MASKRYSKVVPEKGRPPLKRMKRVGGGYNANAKSQWVPYDDSSDECSRDSQATLPMTTRVTDNSITDSQDTLPMPSSHDISHESLERVDSPIGYTVEDFDDDIQETNGRSFDERSTASFGTNPNISYTPDILPEYDGEDIVQKPPIVEISKRLVFHTTLVSTLVHKLQTLAEYLQQLNGSDGDDYDIFSPVFKEELCSTKTDIDATVTRICNILTKGVADIVKDLC